MCLGTPIKKRKRKIRFLFLIHITYISYCIFVLVDQSIFIAICFFTPQLFFHGRDGFQVLSSVAGHSGFPLSVGEILRSGGGYLQSPHCGLYSRGYRFPIHEPYSGFLAVHGLHQLPVASYGYLGSGYPLDTAENSLFLFWNG